MTSADVKYAIERGFFTHRQQPLRARVLRRRRRRRSPARSPARRSPASTTPDERTLVFKLRRPTGGTLAAALVLPLAAPVPREYALPLDREKVSELRRQAGRDRPVHGRLLRAAAQNITLVRNPSWNAETDFRPAYLDRIEMPQGNDDPTIASRRVLNGSHMVTGDYLIPPAVLKQAFDEDAGAAQAGRLRRRPLGGAEHARSRRSTTSTCARPCWPASTARRR